MAYRFSIAEEVEVEPAAGQPMAAVVDGFSAGDQGPYQLQATFTRTERSCGTLAACRSRRTSSTRTSTS